LQTNAYLAWEEPESAVLIDPGDEAHKLLPWIESTGVKPVAAVLTHAHFDHLGALNEVVAAYDLNVYLHPEALPVYQRAANSAARWGFKIPQPSTEPLHMLPEGELKLGPGFKVLHLPGHCPGHLGLYNAKAGVIFSGDVLFSGGVGRWDIPSANREVLAASIRKLFELPLETVVHPGHGPATTLQNELQNNIYVQSWLTSS